MFSRRHWLITMKFPEPNTPREEKISAFEQTAANVLGRQAFRTLDRLFKYLLQYVRQNSCRLVLNNSLICALYNYMVLDLVVGFLCFPKSFMVPRACVINSDTFLL